MRTNQKQSRDSSKRLRVGVTLHIRDGQQSLWENGIFQNCYFLIELLRDSGNFAESVIVSGGPGDPANAGDFLSEAPAPVICMREALDRLDVIIELSAQLDPEWSREFARRGGRIVSMHVASDFVIDAERIVFNLDPGFIISGAFYHEVWTLPAFEATCAQYYRTGLRAPVRVMPHIWSPNLVERTAAAKGMELAYRPGRKRWRLAVMEPNICTVKTCHLPLLLCDVAYRTAPKAVENVRILNAGVLREHPVFVAYARTMDLVRHGLATFEGRFPIFEVLGASSDALVSHHWENAQNYLYYEALHGGFPLIHNSSLLGGCGYRYRDFDPEDGALVLLSALASHDLQLDAYRTQARNFLAGLSPQNPDNVAAFTDAIYALYQREERGC